MTTIAINSKNSVIVLSRIKDDSNATYFNERNYHIARCSSRIIGIAVA